MKQIKTIEDLRGDPENANRGTPRGHGIIEHSLRQHGAGRSGLAARDGTMIAGSQTLEEVAALGIPIKPVYTNGSEWVVVIREDIEPGSEAARLMALEDNRASEVGFSIDPEVFASLAADFDLSPLYFPEEMSAILEGVQEETQADDDTAPVIDETKETRCKPGDVWNVGPHIVACLDSTDVGALDRVVTKKPDMVVADPPYGIEIVNGDGLGTSDGSKPFGSVGATRHRGDQNRMSQIVSLGRIIEANTYAPVIGDDSIETAVQASALCLSQYPSAIHFWWGANNYAHVLPPSTCWIVWDKENTGNFADAELAWSNHKSAVRIFKHMWNGMLRESEHGKRVHPTQKPQALFEFLYSRYGSAGDLILDPFLGSGPSLKAAHRMGDGRRVVGFELSPHYVDHILEWASAEGLTCSLAEGLTCERVVE